MASFRNRTMQASFAQPADPSRIMPERLFERS